MFWAALVEGCEVLLGGVVPIRREVGIFFLGSENVLVAGGPLGDSDWAD